MTAKALLLCTDLDRTLLPNGPEPESPGARDLFRTLASQPGVTLVYVTGRHLGLVEKALANYQIPRPDFAITDVGTRIHQQRDDGWTVWTHWEHEIGIDWGDFDHSTISRLFCDLKPLRLQETSKQNTHKLSYYVPIQANWRTLQEEMAQRLDERGIRASLICSVDEPAGIGLLDVLPERATKLHAIDFLREHQDFATSETVFAGDSGNDLPVLASALPSVLVANASSEVREAAVAQSIVTGHPDCLYLAKGGYLGMNGNYSAGIVEGVVHFQPDFDRILNSDSPATRHEG